MGEDSNDLASKDLLPPDIPTLVQRCLKVEQDRSLSDNSMKELRRYPDEFSSYCQGKNIYFADELTPAFMKICASSTGGKSSFHKIQQSKQEILPSSLENPFAASNDLEYTELYIQL